MTAIRFALGGGKKTIQKAFEGTPASYLVSYVYFNEWDAVKEIFPQSDWVLDSGAYTAYTSGKPIRLQTYIDFVKRLRDTANPPSEIFGLDVIGDWEASLKNIEQMWAQGIEAIPTYHAGEPERDLRGIARD